MSNNRMIWTILIIVISLVGAYFLRNLNISVPVTSLSFSALRATVEKQLPASYLAKGSAAVTRRPSLPLLSSFSSEVKKTESSLVSGVYVPGLFALPIVQQPQGQPAYVSTDAGVVTQFSLAEKYNSLGLLAHNYLSGEEFFKLKKDQYIIVVFGDGRMDYYQVSSVRSFQALAPNSPYSDFIDLADPEGKTLSSTQLFKEIYTNPDQLVFQTCIKAFGDPSWGRLFVTAEKVNPREGALLAYN